MSTLQALRARFQLLTPPEVQSPTRISWDTLAGRLTEISKGSGVLSTAAQLVLDAQLQGEPVAWIALESQWFFPPDFAANGIDLSTLVVVRVASSRAAGRAATHLAQSGAFGLIVCDLGNDCFLPMPLQSRLLGLAQKQHLSLVFLTHKKSDAPSIGSLIGLRSEPQCIELNNNRFICRQTILKDKRFGPHWQAQELYDGPPGLR
jgi:recombination protein RecA